MAEEISPGSSEKPAYAKGDEAALHDKAALKPCEACGGEFSPLGLRAFVQTIGDNGKTYRHGTGADAAISVCMDCGLLRFHYVSLLRGKVGG